MIDSESTTGIRKVSIADAATYSFIARSFTIPASKLKIQHFGHE
jgi:hypothetical protein